jgi:mono/diheme cytochrome c family protein
MADQPRAKPLAYSPVFPDGAASRTPPRHTITRNGQEFGDVPRWAATLPADAAAPFAITAADLHRGQQQFTIFCTPCHGQLGDGNGMIPERGFLRPPTYHSDRLRNAPDAYFYNVITNGIGAMYPYNDKVDPDDRWRIVAYIRALQLSQHAAPADFAEAAK